MPEEEELHRKLTAWVRGATSTKMGHAILTTERLVFFDEKFSPNAAFGLANLITDHLQKKHEEGGRSWTCPWIRSPASRGRRSC